ncbi:hypothetical protein ACLKA6_017926 [Drosophila palustris]
MQTCDKYIRITAKYLQDTTATSSTVIANILTTDRASVDPRASCRDHLGLSALAGMEWHGRRNEIVLNNKQDFAAPLTLTASLRVCVGSRNDNGCLSFGFGIGNSVVQCRSDRVMHKKTHGAKTPTRLFHCPAMARGA